MSSTGPAPFTIESSEEDGRVVLSPRGELDLATAPELEAALNGPLNEGRHVELRLAGLEFMDSTGVRILVSGHALAEEAGGSLTIVNAPPGSPVARILDVSGVGEGLGLTTGD
jgi:anti-sigma B factor antagonist